MKLRNTTNCDKCCKGKRISELDEKVDIQGTEYIPYLEGDDNGKFSLGSLKDYLIKLIEEYLINNGIIREDWVLSEPAYKLLATLPELIADRACKDEFGNNINDTYLTRESVKEYIGSIFEDLFTENPPKILDGYITVDMLSDAVLLLLNSGGCVTNFPDDEDLTVKDGKLKFKDKAYDPNSYSGLGRKYLRRNMVGGVNVLTQEMISEPNVIYVILYDYDLRGETIVVPDNCVLKFSEGSLSNGTLIGNNTKINAGYYYIFKELTLKENYILDDIKVEWFNSEYKITQDIIDFLYNTFSAHSYSKRGKLQLNSNRIYYCDNIKIKPNVELDLNSSELIVLNNNGIEIDSNTYIHNGIISYKKDDLITLITIGSYKECKHIQNVYIDNVTIKSTYYNGDLIVLGAYSETNQAGQIISSKLDNIVAIGGACTLKFKMDRSNHEDSTYSPFINGNYINIKWSLGKQYFIMDNTSMIVKGEVSLNEVHIQGQTTENQIYPCSSFSYAGDNYNGTGSRNLIDVTIWDATGIVLKVDNIESSTFQTMYLAPDIVDIGENGKNNIFTSKTDQQRKDINVHLNYLNKDIYCVSLKDLVIVPNIEINQTQYNSKSPVDYIRKIALSECIQKLITAGDYTIPIYTSNLSIKVRIVYYSTNYKEGEITNISNYEIRYGSTPSTVDLYPLDLESAKYIDISNEVSGYPTVYISGFSYYSKNPYFGKLKTATQINYNI